jgi:hypothetical protein
MASNARTVRNLPGRDRVRAAPYAPPDARRSPMGRAPDNHATPLPESGTPHGDVPIRTGVADQLSDVCRPGHYRLRYDHIDNHGKISFRRAGRMHHLGVGASNARRRVLAIADQTTVTVIDLTTGEVLSTHTIDPDRSYWRNQQKAPADGQDVTYDPTHPSHMTRLITLVELRGLEPLTFSLRMHGVDLIRPEHGVIDVQVAAAGAPWLHREGTHGAHG